MKMRMRPARVFPAYAGVNLKIDDDVTIKDSIPRVCGGEPTGNFFTVVSLEYSPRMRG